VTERSEMYKSVRLGDRALRDV